MQNHQLINSSSGKTEYFTPQPIIEAARLTMGRIDLDPASSEQANARVRASYYFTKEQDGLSLSWTHGLKIKQLPSRVWLNWPFGRVSNPLWIAKLEHEILLGHVTEACCITFACTSEKWFQPLLRRPNCFLSPRTNYILPDGSTLRGVPKGSVVTYFGPNVDAFRREFRTLGVVKI